MNKYHVITKVDASQQSSGLVFIECPSIGRIALDCWVPGFVMPKEGEGVRLTYTDGSINRILFVTIEGRIHNQTAPRAPKPSPCTTSSDSSASSTSTTTNPMTQDPSSRPADAAVGIARSSATTDPAREPDEIEAMERQVGAALVSGDHGYRTNRGLPALRDLIALMRRLLAERDAAVDRYEDVLSDLGLHPDTEHATVLAHIDSVRSEARESADAFSRGKAHGNAKVVELLRAAQPQPERPRDIIDAVHRYDDIVRNTGSDSDEAKEARARLAAQLFWQDAQPQPAETSERVQELRAKLEKAIDGLVGESLSPSGNSGNSDLDRLPLHDANREVEHYLDELCALASRVAEPAGDGALRKAAEHVVGYQCNGAMASSVPNFALEDLREALAATKPAEGVPAEHVKWTGNLCEALGLLSTLKGDLDCGRLTNEPVQCAREIHYHVTKQLAAARADARKLRDAIKWALGEGDSDFGEGPNVRGGRYWWRSELRKRAGEALESQAKPEAAEEPVWFEPNEHTKNVCAIRRKSDGYWWECNSEHGAGWNDKRIRQAWTAREARLEVEKHLQGQDVEIVQLMPEMSPAAAPCPACGVTGGHVCMRGGAAAAAPAEREGEDRLDTFVAHLGEMDSESEAWRFTVVDAIGEIAKRLVQRGGTHGSL